jgi:hypothetical protein
MPTVLDSAKGLAEDIFYVSLGIGVITFQKAQVKRQEIKGKLTVPFSDVEKQGTELKDKLVDNILKFDKNIDKAVNDLDELLSPVQEKLPEPIKEVVTKAKNFSNQSRNQFKKILVSTK